MKRVWLLALFVCLITSIASAQIRFSKYFGIPGFADICTDVLILKDSGYFTATASTDFFTIDTLGFAVSGMKVIKTDNNGDTIWTKTYRKKNFSIDFYCFSKTNYGNILVGSITDLVAYHNQQIGSYFAIWKLNELGDTISTSYYDIANDDDYALQLIPTLDSGFMVVGQSCAKIQNTTNCDLAMLKLDSIGNVQWHKTFSNTSASFETGYGLVQHANGDFFLVGNTQFSGIMKSFIVKTNKYGKLIWKKKIDNYPRENINSIVLDKQKNKLFLFGSFNKSTDGTGNTRGLVYCLDTSGIVIWKKYFGGPENSGFFSGTVSENKLVVSGYFENNNKYEGWLFSINLNGDSLFNRFYSICTSSHNFYEIKNCYDGFIMAGFCFNPNDTTANQDAWLLKVDSFGCLIPGCQLVGIDNIPFSREEIRIFPNPAKDNIQFKHSNKIVSYRIADYRGKLLQAGNYLETCINVDQLANGAYIVQVLLENKSQAFGKLIVER